MNIAVIGSGKLGLPLALCMARAHTVNITDKDADVVDAVRRGQSPIEEPLVQGMLNTALAGGHLHACTTTAEAARGADIIFLVVPTPSLDDGTFSAQHLVDACDDLVDPLMGADRFPVLSVVSTVSPGTMAELRDMIERKTLKTCGRDFGMVYNPSFIALGTVVKDFLSPDAILIGEWDHRSAVKISQALWSVIPDKKPHIMSVESAEIAKLALNCMVTSKIAWTCALQEACHRTPGADVDDVLGLIGADSRIGAKYLRAGAPYGGPCFPRDNRAMSAFMGTTALEMSALPVAVSVINAQHGRWITDLVLRMKPARVAIAGRSYKTGIDLEDESYGSRLTDELTRAGVQVVTSMDADVIVLTMPDEHLVGDIVRNARHGQVVVDIWRALDPAKVRARVVRLGVGGNE